ncbi:MAG TPA: hypothetical protein VJQ43_00960, partial [Thermoplasmata archaeon]|nr:hypothetical protein [Thermoplasmata archaeon]
MRSQRDGAEVSAAGFAPGHVSGIFAPRLAARDPRARGSVGAGLVLDVGVRATAHWTPGKTGRTSVRSDPPCALPISTEVA